MIRGLVNARYEPIVRLRVRGPSGGESEVDAIVDTGFTGSLALPAILVETLGLPRQLGGAAVLADGSTRQFDLCAGEVDWDGDWRPVLISAVGSEALVGMRLVAGHRLAIDVMPGGSLEIRPLD